MLFTKPKLTAHDQIRDHYTQGINTKLQAHNTNTLSQIHYIIQNATPKDITKLHAAVQKATQARCGSTSSKS